MDANEASLDQEPGLVSVPEPLPVESVDTVTADLNTNKNSAPDPALGSNSNSTSSQTASPSKAASTLPKLRPREFVWGKRVIRDILPRYTIPAWLDPLYVDIDDPRKLPLCWYGVAFHPDTVFRYAHRIRVAVYMKRENLRLKPGDLDAYGTWPKLVEWFKDQSGLTMHLHPVWDERRPLLTFFNNHEMERVTEDMWMIIADLLDDMDYPEECKPMWYLDRNLSVRLSMPYTPASASRLTSSNLPQF
ncbi:hypothetical protein GSI_10180 [Ganoderma sinense ZZ0214-1]|uniref:Uncharacterized protein n=1 Tax=Ganoderma sinense ZZ0214-1 TaxID=1077348 RepID=A0A2G8RZU6_9APHY|nr:hypothetical protein GSI_10180 [Ganoderma sinense ZZ0214-1]